MQPRHLGAGSGFVDEHQPFGIKVGLAFEPVQPLLQDLGIVLFEGVRRLFLYVIRRRAKNRHSEPMPTPIPCAANSARNSERVMSGVFSCKSRITAAWDSMRVDRRSPPRGWGATRPERHASAAHRMALETLTRNCAAAARRDVPA
jgi:hypothetical protein